MAISNDSFDSRSLFILNENHTQKIQFQISARIENCPLTIFQKSWAFHKLNKMITPIEKTAVLYATTTVINRLFIILLAKEREEKKELQHAEVYRNIINMKNTLQILYETYSYLPSQLNVLKLIDLRLKANFNILLQFMNRSTVYKDDLVAKRCVVDTSLVIAHSIYLIQTHLLDKKKEFSKLPFDGIQVVNKLSDMFSDYSTERKIQESISFIKDDLTILSHLQLAPKTLLPLAIRCFTCSNALAQDMEQVGKLLFESLQYIPEVYQVYLAKASIKKVVNSPNERANQKKDITDMENHAAFLSTNFLSSIKKFYNFIQDSYSELHSKNKTDSAHNQVEICKNYHVKLNRINLDEDIKKIVDLTDLQNIKQLPDFLISDFKLTVSIYSIFMVPFQTAFVCWYTLSIKKLQNHVKNFLQAYKLYDICIPLEQRTMQTDLFAPMDLFRLNLSGVLHQLLISMDDPVITSHLKTFTSQMNNVFFTSTYWWNSNYPASTTVLKMLEIVLNEAVHFFSDLKQRFHEIDVKTDQHIFLMDKCEHLLVSLKRILGSSVSYPFLFSPLGHGLLQKNSFEHPLCAQLLDVMCSYINDNKNNTSRYASCLKPYLESFTWPLDGIRHKLPVTTPENFAENFSKQPNLIEIFGSMRAICSIIRSDDKISDVEHDSIIMILTELYQVSSYQILNRYSSQTSLMQAPIAPPHFSTGRQRVKKASLDPISQPRMVLHSEPEKKNSIQNMKNSLLQIGKSLATCQSKIESEDFEMLQDYYQQILCHMGSIEDLLDALDDCEAILIYRTRALFVHQACAIEQAVKLAALVRLPTKVTKLKLKMLIKNSHLPSEIFSSFFSRSSHIDESKWNKLAKTAGEVDGFLTTPARYATGNHPWLGLLGNCPDTLLFSEGGEKEIQHMQERIWSNLEALEILLEDILVSLQQIRPLVGDHIFDISPIETPFIKGLSEQGLLKRSSFSESISFPLEILTELIDRVGLIQHIMPVSKYESSQDARRRVDEIQANLYIIRVNLGDIEKLLKDPKPESWCSSYASTLLLRTAVILEKSLQVMLYWLPVASGNNPDQHILFSLRSCSAERKIPIRHLHSIQVWGEEIVRGLSDLNENTLSSRLQGIKDNYAWLDPLIKQLYRYPISRTENRSSHILQIFHAFAHLRRDFVEGKLSKNDKERLLPQTASDSKDLSLEEYDELIQTHLVVRVHAPASEVITTACAILKICEELYKKY
jgi:hypothetical protein